MKWFIQSYRDGELTWYDVYLENAGAPVNAVEGVLNVGGLAVDAVFYGDSLLRYWVSAPRFEQGEIAFSGVRPFGFTGEKLFVMRLKSVEEASAQNFVMENFQVLAHDGQGTPLWEGEKIAVSDQRLDKVPAPILPDTQAPFPVEPQVQKNEDGLTFIPFHAQDDKAGVVKYEFHYADGRVETFDDAGVLWLKEGQKAQFLWVYDLAGNVRKEKIQGVEGPVNLHVGRVSFYEVPLFWLGVILLLVLVAFVVRRFFMPKA